MDSHPTPPATNHGAAANTTPVDNTTAPMLIATDVDGTLINSSERISPRTRSVLQRAVANGAYLALATGRPPRWISPILDQLPVRPLCVCANGAVIYDSKTSSPVVTHTLQPKVLQDVVATCKEAIIAQTGLNVGVAVERVEGSGQAEHEIFLTSHDYDPAWVGPKAGFDHEAGLLAVPAVKLLLRVAGARSQELYDIVSPLVDPAQAHVTFSIGEGLLEFAAPGVDKARGVADVAKRLGIPQARTIAFGDMPNDREMLHWAGHGVAMGNALPAVKERADEVTDTNDNDGMAKVLERWF